VSSAQVTPMFPKGEHWTNPRACTTCGRPVVVDRPSCRYCGEVHVDVHCSWEHEQMGGLQGSLEDYVHGIAANAQELGHERALNVTTEDDWTSRAWAAILAFVDEGRHWDAADLRAEVGAPPSTGAPGAIIRRAAAGLIGPVGYCRSRSLTRRGGLQLRWGPA
jgi:hypothetical protein